MTRRELIRLLLEKYGQEARVNGGTAYALIRPIGLKNDRVPMEYLYTGTPDQKPAAGDVVATAEGSYVTARSGVETVAGEELYVWAVLRGEREAALCTEE